MSSPRKGLVFPSAKANEIIEELNIREPSEIQLKDISMMRGVFVNEKVLKGSEARLVRRGASGIITVNSRIPEEGRKRFAIAHELGHFELHKASQFVFCSEENMFDWNKNDAQEVEANKFAASILMPKVIFEPLLKAGQPNLEIVRDLSGKYRTTLTATALRYVELSSEPCAVAITINDIIKWYNKSPSFSFHIKVGERLSPIIESTDSDDAEVIPRHPIKVPASAWLAGVDDASALIFEQSVALGNYGIVLSLLWIFNEIRTSYHRDAE